MVLTFEEALQSIHEALGEIHKFASHASLACTLKKNQNLLYSECQFALNDNIFLLSFPETTGLKRAFWFSVLFLLMFSLALYALTQLKI